MTLFKKVERGKRMYRDERRMFERFEVSFPMEFKQPGGQEISLAKCCDISAGGIGLFSQKRIVPNTLLEISLGIPDGRPPLRCLAYVIWSRQVKEDKWRLSLEFRKVDFMGISRVLRC